MVLDVGEPCWVASPTSGAIWAFDTFTLTVPFHLMIERGRFVRRTGVIIHTSESIPLIDRDVVDGLPVLSATRTIIDLARTESAARLTTALDSALRDGLTSEAFLHKRIAELRGSGRYGIPRLLEVIDGSELSRGGHSWLERRFLELLGAARLPRPSTQQVLTRTRTAKVRVDCSFVEVPLVVELLGYRWHRTKAQMARDADRVNALQMAGHLVLQVPYERLALQPEIVVADVTQALTVLGWTR